MGVLDISTKSFENYKRDWFAAFIYGIGKMVLIVIFYIPVIGAFLYAWLWPKLLSWYYNRTYGEVKSNNKVAFTSLLIPLLIINIGVILIGVSAYGVINKLLSQISYTNTIGYSSLSNYLLTAMSTSTSEYGLVGAVIMLLGLIAYIFSLYTIYGSILGKVEKMQYNAYQSLRIFGYMIFYGILFISFGFILAASGLDFGNTLSVIYYIWFVTPLMELIVANVLS